MKRAVRASGRPRVAQATAKRPLKSTQRDSGEAGRHAGAQTKPDQGERHKDKSADVDLQV